MRTLPLLLLLSACAPSLSPPYLTLIDQRTFNPAVAPNPADVRALPPLPLAVVRFDAPGIDYRPDLARAVEAAQSRKPDADFNVVTPVGRGKSPDAQAQDDATAIVRAIAEQGVQPEKIHIGLVEDAGTPAREVRVYVR